MDEDNKEKEEFSDYCIDIVEEAIKEEEDRKRYLDEITA